MFVVLPDAPLAGPAAGGSRLEDELVITINKAISQASPAYKRIGVIGSLALLRQAAADYELVSNVADQPAASKLRYLLISSQCSFKCKGGSQFHGVCLPVASKP
jgi:hypothetical protein